MDPSCSAALSSWGSWLLTPLSFIQGGELCWAITFPLGAKQCWPRIWDGASKMKWFSLSFFCGYSQISVPLCYWSFICGLLSCLRALSFMDHHWMVLRGDGSWTSHFTILVLSCLIYYMKLKPPRILTGWISPWGCFQFGMPPFPWLSLRSLEWAGLTHSEGEGLRIALCAPSRCKWRKDALTLEVPAVIMDATCTASFSGKTIGLGSLAVESTCSETNMLPRLSSQIQSRVPSVWKLS